MIYVDFNYNDDDVVDDTPWCTQIHQNFFKFFFLIIRKEVVCNLTFKLELLLLISKPHNKGSRSLVTVIFSFYLNAPDLLKLKNHII
jgi:hypothetical protein